jgi:hypothetical protein
MSSFLLCVSQYQLGAPRPATPPRNPLQATEIGLYPNVTNRHDGFWLSKSWEPPICSLKYRRKTPLHDSIPGFSGGVRRSVLTAIIRAQNMPPSGTHQRPTVMSRLPSPKTAPSFRPRDRDSPYTSVPCPTHSPRRLFPRPSRLLLLSPIGSLGGRMTAQRFYSIPR